MYLQNCLIAISTGEYLEGDLAETQFVLTAVSSVGTWRTILIQKQAVFCCACEGTEPDRFTQLHRDPFEFIITADSSQRTAQCLTFSLHISERFSTGREHIDKILARRCGDDCLDLAV